MIDQRCQCQREKEFSACNTIAPVPYHCSMIPRISLRSSGLRSLYPQWRRCRALFRRKDFLDTDLIDEARSADVRQMCPLLVIRQGCTNAIGHHHHERSIVHIQPIRAADELIGAVSDEWAIDIPA
jgi:hypothetical protein